MRQKICSISIIVGLLVLVAAAGGTVAYYTVERTAHNVITTGGVKIGLYEIAEATVAMNGAAIPFTDLPALTPGEVYRKAPYVKNLDTEPVWVRAALVMTRQLGDGSLAMMDSTLLSVDFNNEDWIKGLGGYYYYNKVLAVEEDTVPLFTRVKFGESGDSETAGVFTLTVKAEAVQAKNNGESVMEALGWAE